MTTRTRPVKILPEGIQCGYHSGCLSSDRENAIHETTESTYRIPAGTPLCGYHSPYDVTPEDRAEQIRLSLHRYEVELTPASLRTDRVIHTFSWGTTRAAAYARVAEMLDNDPETWEGWNFTVALYPTVINPA